MSDAVIDASVAVKWVIDETDSDRAQKLYEDIVLRHDRPIGPPPVMAEVINAIYQRMRSRDPERSLSEAEATAALTRFLELPFLTVEPDGLYQRAFAFARARGLSNIYDTLYVVLAEMLEVEMWTDDRVLLRALGRAAPWVRRVGDYPLE